MDQLSSSSSYLLGFIIMDRINYMNLKTGEIHNDIWDYLYTDNWKNIHPENFEYNNLIGVSNRKNSKPVVGHFLPLEKGMKWLSVEKKIIDPTYVPDIFEANLDSFLTAAEAFFNKFKDKKIGVQLSGGLDSSIIIGLLKHFKIPFYLIGLTTRRYEFRTERHIQQIISNWAIDTILIDYELHLPLSNLDKIPKHQYPNLLVNNYSANNAMAIECNRLGIQVLFTGAGGDNVFAEAIPFCKNQCNWIPQTFGDSWLAENVYSIFNIDLISFYEDEGILDAIYNLRIGQPEDNTKLWARNFFKEFIPSELVQFSYCADFWGLYISGLQNALTHVKILCNRAFELTNNDFFSNESIDTLLSQDLFSAKKEVFQKIEARISLAIWINTLHK